MSTRVIRMGVIVALACVPACGRHLNAEYCAAHPDDEDCKSAGDAMIPDGPKCTSNADCTTGERPVCDTNRGESVECTPDQNVCHDPTPVCDLNDTCQQVDCASHVVLPNGMCANEGDVIYVQPGPDTGLDCMQLTPCSLQEGFANHLRPRFIIHLADGSYTGPFTFDVSDITVILFGLKATLNNPGGSNMPVVTIPTNSRIELDYLKITNGNGGVVCASGATLTAHGIKVASNP